jgi:sphingomyelin phosphodiesterase acid-like 3
MTCPRARERRTGIMRFVLAAIVAVSLAMPACQPQEAGPPPTAGQILVLSDLHFDPMADPKLVDRLAAAEPDQWQAILESSGGSSLGRYGRDTNWRLLRSALGQAGEALPNPSFVLISGDFLAHDFRREFDAAARNHSDLAYRAFLRKTMQFLAQQLRQTFPTAAILPALGNNDEECGDYQLQPGGPFLADTLPIVRGLAGNTLSPSFDRNWWGYGNFSAKVGGVRVLSTNTNFLSIHYRNACGSPSDPDPGRATLAWLETELAAAQQAREPVWLLYHIPPGIDGYATLREGTCPAKIVTMWDPAYADAFDRLLRRYSNTIFASFAGHTHMDDFRLIGDGEGHYGFALITPAISPIFGQNPGFRTAVYDPAGGILDQTTYYLTNLTETSATPPVWRQEYTFSREWGLPRIDLASLDQLYSATAEVPAEREHWHRLFPVSSAGYWAPFSRDDRLAQAVRAFRCATGNVQIPDYRQCYCGG